MRAPGWVADAIDGCLEISVAGSYSRLGYEVRRRLDSWQEIGDMTGKVVVVTGATSGIGKAAAADFVAAGADVTIVGRSPERLAATAAEIGGPHVAVADLSDLDQARQFVVDFLAQNDRLDVLIHNAGALVPDYRDTPQGYEDTYASQVLSQHIITSGLLPALQATRGRVIVVSSGGMYTQQLDPDTVEMTPADFDGVVAYARAKRAQVELTQEWARRFADSGVTFHAMHPGWADTPGVRTSLPTFHRVTGPFLRTPQQGADTIVWLAASPDALAGNGLFWLDRRTRRVARLPGTGTDSDTAALMWEQVCRQTQTRPGVDPVTARP